MPYVKNMRREVLKPKSMAYAQDPGELNFQVTSLVNAYILREQVESYAGYNEAIGVLEAVKLELYRRMVVPYEEQKREVNGDVFPERGDGGWR